MEFGALPPDRARGAILAHSVILPDGRLRKGLVLGPDEVGRLEAAGIARVTVARPGADDIAEDEAATLLARALVPDPAAAGLRMAPAFTGRVNLLAERPGLVALDAGAITAFNAVDPAITLATLAPLARVAPGMLVATVKIIPYAAPAEAVARACRTLSEARIAPAGVRHRGGQPAVGREYPQDGAGPQAGAGAAATAAIRDGAPFTPAAAAGALALYPVVMRSAGLVLTEVPGQSSKLNAKAREVTGARLAALGMELAETRVVPHETDALARALDKTAGEMLLILTGSATSDIADTGPQALLAAGGVVERFGMPVDPGNLLFLGRLGARPVIGLPGCARAPTLNGADWVLERLVCGIAVDARDIAAMGVGGLLKEIPTRPQPREARHTGG